MTPCPTFRLSPRNLTALTMMVIYLCISLAPLLSPALRSKAVLHVLTGECTGECVSCGCSARSSSNGTCCCAKKRQQLAESRENEKLPECCKKAPPSTGTVTLSCGCPCGDSKSVLAFAGKSGEVLPFYFQASLRAPRTAARHLELPHSLTSRLREPPDPPPAKLS